MGSSRFIWCIQIKEGWIPLLKWQVLSPIEPTHSTGLRNSSSRTFTKIILQRVLPPLVVTLASWIVIMLRSLRILITNQLSLWGISHRSPMEWSIPLVSKTTLVPLDHSGINLSIKPMLILFIKARLPMASTHMSPATKFINRYRTASSQAKILTSWHRDNRIHRRNFNIRKHSKSFRTNLVLHKISRHLRHRTSSKTAHTESCIIQMELSNLSEFLK
jgi:hypothetical protein